MADIYKTDPYEMKRIHCVFDPTISQDEVIRRYTQVAEFYEQEVGLEDGYTAPKIVAEAVGDAYKANRDSYTILDIAAGTGLVGKELKNLGFKTIDCMEPSEGMFKLSTEKKVYRNLHNVGLSKDPLSFDKDSYDAITICAWHGSPEPLCDSIEEMIRVVKSGGIIVILMWIGYVTDIPQYKDTLFALLSQLEKDKKLKKMELKGHVCYPNGIEAARIIYEVC